MFEVMFPKKSLLLFEFNIFTFFVCFSKEKKKRIDCLVTIFVMETKKNKENMKNMFNYYYNYFWF